MWGIKQKNRNRSTIAILLCGGAWRIRTAVDGFADRWLSHSSKAPWHHFWFAVAKVQHFICFTKCFAHFFLFLFAFICFFLLLSFFYLSFIPFFYLSYPFFFAVLACRILSRPFFWSVIATFLVFKKFLDMFFWARIFNRATIATASRIFYNHPYAPCGIREGDE